MIWRYRITGVVRDEAGAPWVGLLVRAWDEDLVFDDHLGDVRTDTNGRFELEFTDEAFRSIFDENPDLYLRIYDGPGGQEMYSTRGQVRYDAGAEEHYEIEIPRSRLG